MTVEVVLPPKLDLSAAAPLLADLSGVDGPVRLDASNTRSIGSLCLQILISAARHARKGGHDFTVSGLSEDIRSQLRIMGVTEETLLEGCV